MGQRGGHDPVLSEAMSLPADTRSPRAARVFTAGHMATAGCSEDEISTASLVVSELVTNAVQHADSGATLHLSVFGDHVVLGVEDSSTTMPTWRDRSQWDVDGRGMAIVSALGDVKVVGLSTGKVVEVSLPRG